MPHLPPSRHTPLLILLGIVLALTAGRAARADDQSAENQRCLRCHAMATLAYRDRETGAVRDLSLSPVHLARSVHGEMDCTECHRKSFRRFPHPDQLKPNELSCVGCHEDDPREDPYPFTVIDAEYQQSVHARSQAPAAADFSCHSCHDPHRFRAAQVGDGIEQIVQTHNQVCLSCHQTLRDPRSPAHTWLPNRTAHFGAARCIDCHTPTGVLPSHTILAAADSARDCVGCHSADARLRQRLYDFRSAEELERSGWLSKAIYNEAYVVGLSRNPTIDRLALAGLGVMVLLLIGHAAGRYLVWRDRGGRT